MLIEDKDHIYMLDRKNNAFQIHRLSFPTTPQCTDYLTDTLLDGVSRRFLLQHIKPCIIFVCVQEFVIDRHKETEYPRYLVYDIITCNVSSTA